MPLLATPSAGPEKPGAGSRSTAYEMKMARSSACAVRSSRTTSFRMSSSWMSADGPLPRSDKSSDSFGSTSGSIGSSKVPEVISSGLEALTTPASSR